MAKRNAIISALDTYLDAIQFRDYAPVGLQVEGAAEVSRITAGVSLSLELIERAVDSEYQMVLVHHGTFWKGDSPVLRGTHKQRLKALLDHDVSLLAYHLPLDAHPVVGNNAQLLEMVGVGRRKPFGSYNGTAIGCSGALDKATPLDRIIERLRPLTPTEPICFPGTKKTIKRIGAVSGGAGSMFQQAIDAGLDLFITGESWEPAQALARETGVGFLALGHYNSEKPGVMALGAWLRKRFKVAVDFVDIPNPA